LFLRAFFLEDTDISVAASRQHETGFDGKRAAASRRAGHVHQ
jgi:hypothetical protein